MVKQNAAGGGGAQGDSPWWKFSRCENSGGRRRAAGIIRVSEAWPCVRCPLARADRAAAQLCPPANPRGSVSRCTRVCRRLHIKTSRPQAEFGLYSAYESCRPFPVAKSEFAVTAVHLEHGQNVFGPLDGKGGPRRDSLYHQGASPVCPATGSGNRAHSHATAGVFRRCLQSRGNSRGESPGQGLGGPATQGFGIKREAMGNFHVSVQPRTATSRRHHFQ